MRSGDHSSVIVISGKFCSAVCGRERCRLRAEATGGIATTTTSMMMAATSLETIFIVWRSPSSTLILQVLLGQVN